MRAGALAVLALVVVSCGDGADGADRVAGGDPSGDLTVFAAASLTEAFEEIAGRLESQRPGLRVTLNLAGSQTLASQLLEGAPADVFAAADERQMDRVVAAGRAADPEPFATNELVIAVEPGNPLAIASLADLARDDVLLVLPDGEVPAGAYAADALRRAGVEVAPASLELNVRAALGKVVLGEADATIAYRSDLAVAEGRAEAVALPAADQVVAGYPVATVTDAANRPAADAFVALLRAEAGRAVLERHGFGTP